MKTVYLLLGIFFLCPALVFSQGEMTPQDSEDAVQTRKIKHFSVGAKAGSPIGLGFGGEIVIPILGNRIAP